MTHATITPHTAILCNVAFDYDEVSKEAVKALAGATFDDIGKVWTVPILHLPVLKLIFSTMTVAPEVVADYHALLKRMLCDALADHKRLMERELADGEGGVIPSTMQRHAVGISAVLKTGWKPTERPQRIHQPNGTTVTHSADSMPVSVSPAEEKALSLWLRGSKNAVANAEKKAHMVTAVKRKRKQAA